MPIKMLDKITYPFLNFHGAIVGVYEWISYFTPHFIMDVTFIYAGIKVKPC